MINVVTTVFPVESEGYQAIAELRAKPFGEDYVVAEAALLKREGDLITLIDAFDCGVTSDDTAAGMVMGSFLGILGGPIGVLLGSAAGALAGSSFDRADAADSISMLEVTALKLFDGEVAIIALVQEEEPAFDAAFAKFDATIMRRDAEAVFDEVARARELEAELSRLAAMELRAEVKKARRAIREDRLALAKERFELVKANIESEPAIAASFDQAIEDATAAIKDLNA